MSDEIKPRIDDDGVGWCDKRCPAAQVDTAKRWVVWCHENPKSPQNPHRGFNSRYEGQFCLPHARRLAAELEEAKKDRDHWYERFTRSEMRTASCCVFNEEENERLRAKVERMRAVVEAASKMEHFIIGEVEISPEWLEIQVKHEDWIDFFDALAALEE